MQKNNRKTEALQGLPLSACAMHERWDRRPSGISLIDLRVDPPGLLHILQEETDFMYGLFDEL